MSIFGDIQGCGRTGQGKTAAAIAAAGKSPPLTPEEVEGIRAEQARRKHIAIRDEPVMVTCGNHPYGCPPFDRIGNCTVCGHDDRGCECCGPGVKGL